MMGHVVLGCRVACVLAGLVTLVTPGYSSTSVFGSQGLSVSVDPSGAYQIQLQSPAWSFAGSVGVPVYNLAVNYGSDAVGGFGEISFDFQSDALRHAGIRVYQNHQAILFTLNCPLGAPNTVAFPSLSKYPSGLQHAAYSGLFANVNFTNLPSDSPWIFFDGSANTLILSPAANFMVAQNSWGPNNELTGGIAPGIASLPVGFTHQVLFVVDSGINRTFDTWGHALTDLRGKTRPANDADTTLSRLSYWTDNGANYYYHMETNAASTFGPVKTYAQTLSAVKSSFDSLGIGLGSLQLDSWFYPKGPRVDWSDSADGIYQYLAAPSLFGSGLANFQQGLGIPLITHARWIDSSSPYRQQYKFSGGVSTDPQYWADTAAYLKTSGVTVYEQDWLGAQAQTDFNLVDGEAFLGNMATAMASQGIHMQYCMATPRHFLQGSNYSNLTSIRTSGDRFEPGKWTAFLYSSRLAGSLGIWPFADVFMSTETSNLILATLSAGPVGLGDKLGSLSAANLLRAARKDGTIVKPDVPATPIDSSFLNDAAAAATPVIASTYSDFDGLRTNYIFAYPQGGSLDARFRLSETGGSGEYYLYDYAADSGVLANATDPLDIPIANSFVYLIAAPVGKSGMAVIGDTGNFVSMGKKRISSIIDNGQVHLTVQFAPGETSRTIEGYSPDAPRASANHGTAGAAQYDPASHRFRVAVSPGSDGAASLLLRRVRSGSHIRP